MHVNSTTIRRATAALALGAAITVTGVQSAGAATPGWNSGWKKGTSGYAQACDARVLYGRTADRGGVPFIFGTVANPACQIRVGATSSGPLLFSAWSAAGRANTGVYREGAFAWPYATFGLETRIPGFGSLAYGEMFLMNSGPRLW